MSGVVDADPSPPRPRLGRILVATEPEEEPRDERSPAAVIRLLVALVGIVVIEVLARVLPATHDGLQRDLHERAGAVAIGVGRLASATATVWSVLLIVAAIVAALLAHRPRHVGVTLLAGGLAAAVVLTVARVAGPEPGTVPTGAWGLAVASAGLAVGAVSFTVVSALPARWSAVGISVTTLVGVLGADVSLAPRGVALLGGVAVGSAVAAALGTPSRDVTRRELLAGLERTHVPVASLERFDVDARGSQPWRGTLATGRDVFIKVTATDELRATQLFRFWRRLVLRDAGDEPAGGTVKREAEHEAFVAQWAQAAGVRTPTVIAVATVGDQERRGFVTVFDAVDGVTMDGARPGELTDSVLRQAWSQIQVMRRATVAHRDLRTANLLIADGEVWVIDFGFAEVAASDALLDRDIAEFLVSSAALVGTARSVDNAVAVLGADAVAAAIPWIQPAAVSAASRRALSRPDFAELRELVRAAAGIGAPELPQLQRVSWRGVAMVAALGVAVWTLLPQLAAGLDFDAVLAADPRWAAAALVASASTYLGAALSISGSVGGGTPLPATLAAQVASSFTNRITPARVGGMALNLRFLVRRGFDKATAATGVAVSTAAGAAVHVTASLVALVWAGSGGFPGVSMPSGRVVLTVLGLLLLTAAVVAAVPSLRRRCVGMAVPAMRRSILNLLVVLRSPRSMVMVLGGSVLVTVMNVVALGVSLLAFGQEVDWAAVALVYLAGTAIASAAPTPGGLGAAEAALVAGLAVIGVARDAAIPAVLLFRLATFWLPILPGWIALVLLQRRGDL